MDVGDVFLAVANVDLATNNKNRPAQKRVVLEQVLSVIILSKVLAFEVHRLVHLCFFAEKRFVATCQFLQCVEFYWRNWLLTDVVKNQVIFR